jgi:hypothetical protein
MSAPAPQWATFTPIAMRQIDLFCMPLQINTEKPLAGSIRRLRIRLVNVAVLAGGSAGSGTRYLAAVSGSRWRGR